MKPRDLSVKAALGLVTLASLLTVARTVEAHGFSRRHARWARVRTVVVLPTGAIPLRVADGSYYYCRGRYYKHRAHGYVAIPAPVGAVIPRLPEGHRTIVIDGITYHEYDGVYYKGGLAGYTVVPIAQAAPAAGGAPGIAGPGGLATAQQTTVVNVPNTNGSYTPVTLQLASSGMYIGPQGEIYPNLPTVTQLQTMYGK